MWVTHEPQSLAAANAPWYHCTAVVEVASLGWKRGVLGHEETRAGYRGVNDRGDGSDVGVGAEEDTGRHASLRCTRPHRCGHRRTRHDWRWDESSDGGREHLS